MKGGYRLSRPDLRQRTMPQWGRSMAGAATGMSERERVHVSGGLRCKNQDWRIHYYNQRRPHSALGWMTSSEFTEGLQLAAEYTANMKPVIPDYDWIIFRGQAHMKT